MLLFVNLNKDLETVSRIIYTHIRTCIYNLWCDALFIMTLLIT